jgi:hypothetical protein
MTRTYLRLALVIAAMCAAAVLFIRAQPYDDGGLRALLTPPTGCPVPCFLGIRPGVTTPEDALAILRAAGFDSAALHAWSHPDRPARIDWTAPSRRDRFQAIRVDFRANLVTDITISTSIALAEVRLLWGGPDAFLWTTAAGQASSPVHLIYFEDYSLYNTWVTHSGICPYHPIRHRVDFRWTKGEGWPPPVFGPVPYTQAGFLLPARTLRHNC